MSRKSTTEASPSKSQLKDPRAPPLKRRPATNPSSSSNNRGDLRLTDLPENKVRTTNKAREDLARKGRGSSSKVSPRDALAGKVNLVRDPADLNKRASREREELEESLKKVVKRVSLASIKDAHAEKETNLPSMANV